MTTEKNALSAWKLAAWRIGLLLVVIGITVFVYLIRDQVETLQQYGYIGLFLINLIGSATIILPAPALAIVFAMAGLKAFDPFWIGVAAGLGATIGELSGYAAGFSGQAIVENTRLYDRLYGWTQQYGMIPVFVLAILPLPFFDLAGIASGTLKMPLPKFLLATLAGKLIKMWLVAYAAAYSIAWAAQFFR